MCGAKHCKQWLPRLPACASSQVSSAPEITVHPPHHTRQSAQLPLSKSLLRVSTCLFAFPILLRLTTDPTHGLPVATTSLLRYTVLTTTPNNMSDDALTPTLCTVGGNAVSAFLSWRLSATNACDVTLVWKGNFDTVSQYGISFRYAYPEYLRNVFLR